MKVRYTCQAVADLLGIADYIRDRNPLAAMSRLPSDQPSTCWPKARVNAGAIKGATQGDELSNAPHVVTPPELRRVRV